MCPYLNSQSDLSIRQTKLQAMVHSAAIVAIPEWQIVIGNDTWCEKPPPPPRLKLNSAVPAMGSTVRHTFIEESLMNKFCDVPAGYVNVAGPPIVRPPCADARLLRMNTRMIARRTILTTFMVFLLSLE